METTLAGLTALKPAFDHRMKARKGKVGVTTMRIGFGQGVATVFERV